MAYESKRFAHQTPLLPDDFLRDYTDSRFGRFLLYLLVYRHKALDWDAQASRIGFEGLELLADFRPQGHHIFPSKFLEAAGVLDEKINALANIAVIGPVINIRISAQDPMNYIGRYNITAEKLEQQFINPGIVTIGVSGYETWLLQRAEKLAAAGNAFLTEVGNGV